MIEFKFRGLARPAAFLLRPVLRQLECQINEQIRANQHERDKTERSIDGLCELMGAHRALDGGIVSNNGHRHPTSR